MDNENEELSIWYNYDLSNDKHYIKCIKHLQRMIRGSMTYNVWQKRSKIGINECPICGESKEFVKMESHHYPKTLFDVVDDKLQMEIDFDTLKDKTDFDISQEIMDEHIERKVNYIVLCEYCHKKYHDDNPEVLDKIEEAWKKQTDERNSYFKRKENESNNSNSTTN